MTRSKPFITFRDLTSDADLVATVELQRSIWGTDFPERVPPALLRIGLHLGGVSAGAFLTDGEETLVGFVFGLTGPDEDGRLLHWSHMLGVRPEFRSRGIGQSLKAYQRRRLEALGVPRIQWTYEPLEARNAHLNLNKLGCRVVAYKRNLYGDGGASRLHRGIGTDRFVVEVRLDGTESPLPIGGEEAEVEIPADIQTLKTEDPAGAREWRRRTRAAFESFFEAGFNVVDFQREANSKRCFYCMRKN